VRTDVCIDALPDVSWSIVVHHQSTPAIKIMKKRKRSNKEKEVVGVLRRRWFIFRAWSKILEQSKVDEKE